MEPGPPRVPGPRWPGGPSRGTWAKGPRRLGGYIKNGPRRSTLRKRALRRVPAKRGTGPPRAPRPSGPGGPGWGPWAKEGPRRLARPGARYGTCAQNGPRKARDLAPLGPGAKRARGAQTGGPGPRGPGDWGAKENPPRSTLRKRALRRVPAPLGQTGPGPQLEARKGTDPRRTKNGRSGRARGPPEARYGNVHSEGAPVGETRKRAPGPRGQAGPGARRGALGQGAQESRGRRPT